MGINIFVRILIGGVIFVFLSSFFNYAIYYFFYTVKFVFYYFKFIFVDIMGASPFIFDIYYIIFVYIVVISILRTIIYLIK